MTEGDLRFCVAGTTSVSLEILFDDGYNKKVTNLDHVIDKSGDPITAEDVCVKKNLLCFLVA